jgi:hypothetical protein
MHIREPNIGARVLYDPEYWPPYDITIELDANNDALPQMVVHELLHVIFSPFIEGLVDETLEEVVIVALDVDMWKYISESPQRKRKWEAVVAKKMAAAFADAPSTPYKELVDRT